MWQCVFKQSLCHGGSSARRSMFTALGSNPPCADQCLLETVMTAAGSLLETLLRSLTCSASLITSAHPSPLRFLPLSLGRKDVYNIYSCLEGSYTKGASLETKTGARGCRRVCAWRVGLDGDHQDMGWDNCDGLEGNGTGELLHAGKEVKGKNRSRRSQGSWGGGGWRNRGN